MAAVMIGVDPHKGSHTAVVTGPAEEPLGELRVRACAAQAEQLLRHPRAEPLAQNQVINEPITIQLTDGSTTKRTSGDVEFVNDGVSSDS